MDATRSTIGSSPIAGEKLVDTSTTAPPPSAASSDVVTFRDRVTDIEKASQGREEFDIWRDATDIIGSETDDEAEESVRGDVRDSCHGMNAPPGQVSMPNVATLPLDRDTFPRYQSTPLDEELTQWRPPYCESWSPKYVSLPPLRTMSRLHRESLLHRESTTESPSAARGIGASRGAPKISDIQRLCAQLPTPSVAAKTRRDDVSMGGNRIFSPRPSAPTSSSERGHMFNSYP